jgi:hypothetical protein
MYLHEMYYQQQLKNNMKFKLQYSDHKYIVYPSGYDYGRGFSTLQLAFDYINSILKNYE